MTTLTLCERELADYMLRMTGEKGSIALFSENGASFLEEHYTIDVTGGRGSIRRWTCCISGWRTTPITSANARRALSGVFRIGTS